MKRLLFLLLAIFALTASSQELINGVYEKKDVFNADSLKSGTLFVRALETLSDWAGSQQRSKINIDVQDKDEGLIVYKGRYYLGYGKANMLYGWETFADFTLKVRCKNERVQLSVIVPSLTFEWDGDSHGVYSFPLTDFLPTYKYKGNYKIKKAANQYAPLVPEVFSSVVKSLGSRITKKTDDDF